MTVHDKPAGFSDLPSRREFDPQEGHLHRNLKALGLRDGVLLTLKSGSITVRTSNHRIATEGGASTDNAAEAKGGYPGMVLILHADDTTKTVVVRHNDTGEGTAGNRYFLDGDADHALDDNLKMIMFLYRADVDSGNGGWQEVGRSDRGGYSERKACDTTLTLSTSFQDVSNASVTLPTPGTYLILTAFHFVATVSGAAGDDFIGTLTNSADVEQSSAQAVISDLMVSATEGIIVSQFWRITTTTNNEVFKLRARRNGATGTFIVSLNLTQILAFSIPGGGPVAGHDAVTLSGTPDYLTLNGQDIVRGQVDLAADVSGLLPAASVVLPLIGSPTYTHVEHLNTVFHSTGWVSGGAISDAGGATINVAAGAGVLRATDSAVAQLLFADWSASNGLAITADSIRYIGVEYNAGSPQVVVRTTFNWNFNTDFPLGTVVNEGGTLHIQFVPHKVGDHASNMIQRVYGVRHIARDAEVGGLAFSESGTRRVVVSAGAFWVGLTSVIIPAIDTDPGVGDTFVTYSAGGQEATGVSQWPNEQYDNGGTLTNMTTNRWANLWWYLELDGDLVMVYGTNQYTSEALAGEETAPTTLPNRLQVGGVLAARFIFKKSEATTAQILSAFESTFTVKGVTDHDDLGGVTAGQHHAKYLDADAVAAIEAEDPLDLAGVVNFAKNLNLPHAGELTIGSVGFINVTGSYHTVDTINDDPTDNINFINNAAGEEPADGQFLIISPAHDDRTIVLRHEGSAVPGGILCVGQANITLDDVEDFAILIYSLLQHRWFAMSPGSTLAHGISVHTGIVGERQVEIVLPLKKALPAATNNATLDDDYLYKKPYNVARRINKWYIRFESNLAAEAIFELRKNGTVLSGSSITIAAAARDAAIDSFTEVTLADGDSLEVFQTGGDAENVGGRATVFGDEDIVSAVS